MLWHKLWHKSKTQKLKYLVAKPLCGVVLRLEVGDTAGLKPALRAVLGGADFLKNQF